MSPCRWPPAGPAGRAGAGRCRRRPGRRQPKAGAQGRGRHPLPRPAELKAFAAEVAARRDWDPAWVMVQLADARQLPRVARLIMPPPAGTAKNWAAYRDRFVEPRRIGRRRWPSGRPTRRAGWRGRAGATACRPRWWWASSASRPSTAASPATSASRRAGHAEPSTSPPAAATAAPSSAASWKSSWCWCAARGARRQHQGLVRRRHRLAAVHARQHQPPAVDFDGDGHIDLQRSVADAIGSVAHYLQQHGWQRGMPTHFAVSRRRWTTAGRAAAGARHPAQLHAARSSPSRARCWTRPAPPRRPAGAGGAAERRRRAQPRGRHAELLCRHALQLVELLRAWR
jgi:hypothetical protein